MKLNRTRRVGTLRQRIRCRWVIWSMEECVIAAHAILRAVSRLIPTRIQNVHMIGERSAQECARYKTLPSPTDALASPDGQNSGMRKLAFGKGIWQVGRWLMWHARAGRRHGGGPSG
jgi:hypothetical protein